MRLYSVKLCEQGNPFIDTLENVMSALSTYLKDSDKGEVMTIESIEMTPEEFSQLPEWDGP